jgi:single-strand DNA-binding protein
MIERRGIVLNKVFLIGRLGKDPEVRFTPDGTQTTSFSVATDETWKNKKGEKQQRTEWHNIVTWDKLAEICATHLTKGSQVYIEGKIQTQKYQDKNSGDRHSTKIVANTMKMLGAKREPGDEDQQGPTEGKDGTYF